MLTSTYPGLEWTRILPSEAGFDPIKLTDAKCWLNKRVGDTHYRVVIIRGGRLVAEWKHGFGPKKRFPRMRMNDVRNRCEKHQQFKEAYYVNK